jgi:polysaccharide pyruvyl transferase WcaK-like protein
MTTVCITGLCLGGNKGGPAILSSIIALLRSHIEPLSVVVESADLGRDRPWQAHYNVDLVPRPILTKRLIPRYLNQRLSVYRDKDLVIDMHGVKFHGPKRIVPNILDASVTLLPKMLGIPAVAFTQSYGPFGNLSTRIAARIALGPVDLLFARESESVAILEAIGLGKKCQLFPDVAMVLPCVDLGELRCSTEVKDFVIDSEPYVGLSLSTKVIFEEKRQGTLARYEDLMFNFVGWLLDQQYRVLFIPHTYQPHKPDSCDLRLALRVFENLTPSPGQCLVVQDDLPPDELKTLISRSSVFVGSRYHSLVAALSTGVPSLSVGWSHKYDGLLSLFGMRQFSTWADRVTLGEIQSAFQDLISHREEYSRAIQANLPDIKRQAKKSVEEIASLVSGIQ